MLKIWFSHSLFSYLLDQKILLNHLAQNYTFFFSCILLLENCIEAYKKLLAEINILNISLHLKGHSP